MSIVLSSYQNVAFIPMEYVRGTGDVAAVPSSGSNPCQRLSAIRNRLLAWSLNDNEFIPTFLSEEEGTMYERDRLLRRKLSVLQTLAVE